jgi:hypothetical protein
MADLTETDVPASIRNPKSALRDALLLVLAALVPGVVHAQQPDTTGARADSLRDLATLGARRAALEARAPAPLASDSVPARAPVLTFRGLLDAASGTFAYRTESLEGPDGLSRLGAPPEALDLRWGPFLYNSLITGAVLFDRPVPAWTDALAWSGPRVDAPLRGFDAPRPLTEVRYAQAGEAQLAEVVHAQARRRRYFGADGVLRAAGGYAGRAGDGLFPNQRLTRGRTLMGRAGFFGTRSSVEALVVHARGTYGASGGVLPADPSDPGSIYDVFRATVRDEEARRFGYRTDAALIGAYRGARLALVSAWEGLEYGRAPGDTTRGRVRRLGVQTTIPTGLGRGAVIEAEAYADRGAGVFSGTGRTAALHAADTLGALAARAGVTYTDGAGQATGHAAFTPRIGPLRLVLEAGQAVAPPSAVRRGGFGPYLDAPAEAAAVHRFVRAGASITRGPVFVGASVFTRDDAFPVWAGAAGQDTLGGAMRVTVPRTGLLLEAAVRGDTRRGLYGTAWTMLAPVSETSPVARGLPDAFGDGRLGVRAALFRRDLVLDAYARVRAWTASAGRTVHEPTGLLVLNTGADVPAGSTLDLVAVMRVRTATLHLAYDNALAGTALVRGVQVIPGYPLPPQRLRFGVFWPIFD